MNDLFDVAAFDVADPWHNAPHRGDTPRPPRRGSSEEEMQMARCEARKYFHGLIEPRRVPAQHDCWNLWGPGVPCLHPDGIGHLGPCGWRP